MAKEKLSKTQMINRLIDLTDCGGYADIKQAKFDKLSKLSRHDIDKKYQHMQNELEESTIIKQMKKFEAWWLKQGSRQEDNYHKKIKAGSIMYLSNYIQGAWTVWSIMEEQSA